MDGKCALTLHASETKAPLIHTSRRIFVPGLRRVEDGISQPSGSIHNPFLVLARLLDDSALDWRQRASTDFKVRELIESYVCLLISGRCSSRLALPLLLIPYGG